MCASTSRSCAGRRSGTISWAMRPRRGTSSGGGRASASRISSGCSWMLPARASRVRNTTALDSPEMSDQQELSADEVYARLREAVDRGSRDLASTRGLAERFWPVSADKPLERRPGPKGWLAFQATRVLRKTMRWYVEPAFADQRIVNDALLRLVDDLARRVDELETRDSGLF